MRKENIQREKKKNFKLNIQYSKLKANNYTSEK